MAVLNATNAPLTRFYGTPMHYIGLKAIILALENYFRLFEKKRK